MNSKKTLTLAEAKEFFDTEKVFETNTCFGVNRFGKYQPNITFVIPKQFEVRDGKLVHPFPWKHVPELTQNMNWDFDGGDVSVIFGDFWRGKKGTGNGVFRPKKATEATHVLICVDWGGPFARTRGCYLEEGFNPGSGITYFRKASSNGGGTGSDYYVVPVNWKNVIWDEELDGPMPEELPVDPEHLARVKAICEKVDSE